MADTKFTPGPWSPSEQRGTPGHCTVAQVFGPDGKSLAMIEPTVDASVATANAYLSASSPDLYAALKGAIGALEYSVDCARDDGNNADIDFAQSKLEAALNAIAKAEGKESR